MILSLLHLVYSFYPNRQVRFVPSQNERSKLQFIKARSYSPYQEITWSIWYEMRIYTLNTYLWQINSNCKKGFRNPELFLQIGSIFSELSCFGSIFKSTILYQLEPQANCLGPIWKIIKDIFSGFLWFFLVSLSLSFVLVLWHSIECALIMKKTELNTYISAKKSWAILTFTMRLKIDK